MGSKNAKGRGRATETKVKNRGEKIVQRVRLNLGKANLVIDEAIKNGLKATKNEIFAAEPRSIRHLRKLIGMFQRGEINYGQAE